MNGRSLINGKVYLSCNKIGDNYFECFYCFFRDGSIVRTGFEDFSLERLKSCTKLYNVRIYKCLGAGCGSSGRRYTDSTNLYLLADKSVTMASLSRYIVDNDEIFGFARLERCYAGYATNLFQFSSAWGAFIARIEEYPEKISDYTNDMIEDTTDTTEDTTDTTEDTTDTTEDTTDTTEDTTDTTEDTTVILCALDDVCTDTLSFPLVPRWLFQRVNISPFLAVLAACACSGCSDRRKRVIVKPVPFLAPYLEIRTGGKYPFKVVDPNIKELWDCRYHTYYYDCPLVAPPPDDFDYNDGLNYLTEIPF